MRVVEFTGLTRMDGFAALDAAPLSGPGIGGFRFVRARPAERSGLRALLLGRLAGARLRVTGSLAVLFVGGLTLAVIAGPASCPCEPQPGAAASIAAGGDAHALSRFAYTRATAIGASQPGAADPLPGLAAVIEPVGAMGASPISTSALPPAREAPARRALAKPAPPGVLPSKIEPLADTRPSLIRLAAAGGTDEIIPVLPMVEVVAPDAPEAAILQPEASPAAESEIRPRLAPKRHKRSTVRARRAKPGMSASSAASKKIVRAPRWAQQMFENPWQDKAFSYIR